MLEGVLNFLAVSDKLISLRLKKTPLFLFLSLLSWVAFNYQLPSFVEKKKGLWFLFPVNIPYIYVFCTFVSQCNMRPSQ